MKPKKRSRWVVRMMWARHRKGEPTKALELMDASKSKGRRTALEKKLEGTFLTVVDEEP